MKAMIFAAGLGTRLKPLTDNLPKALVPINGITLLEYAIEKLKKAGVTGIIINVHYLADKVEVFLKEKNNFGINICLSDEREELLNTGGGLKKALDFFDTVPFFVYNVDILSNIDLRQMYDSHIENKALATLAVSRRKTSRYLLFNERNELCAWENRKTAEKKIINSESLLSPLAFSGIQVVSPRIKNHLTENGAFSIIDAYLRLAKMHKIHAYDHTGDLWFDIGKIKEFTELEQKVEMHIDELF